MLEWKENPSSKTQGEEEEKMRTFFLEKDPAFCNYDRDIAVDERFAVIVREGNGNVGVLDADIEGDPEDTLRFV